MHKTTILKSKPLKTKSGLWRTFCTPWNEGVN